MAHVRKSYLLLLAKSLPTTVLDKRWPKPPAALVEVSLFIPHKIPCNIFGLILARTLVSSLASKISVSRLRSLKNLNALLPRFVTFLNKRPRQ